MVRQYFIEMCLGLTLPIIYTILSHSFIAIGKIIYSYMALQKLLN